MHTFGIYRARVWRKLQAALVALLAVVASQAIAAPQFYASLNSNLVRFDATAPGTILQNYGLLAVPYSPVAIDVRPKTGELYGVYPLGGTSYNIRRINLTTARDEALGSVTGGFTEATAGLNYGMAFDPVADQIRVVGNGASSINALFNASTGAAASYYSSLTYAAGDRNAGFVPAVEHIAYTNAVPSPTSRTLFGIDTARDALVRIGSVGSPPGNLVTTIGTTLGVSPSTYGGFVIDPGTGVGYAAMMVGTAPMLYRINLTTGQATLIGQIGTSATFRVAGLALVPGVDPCLDVDGDGQLLATTDGLMLSRIMLGMTGTAVTQGALLPTSTPRSDWGAIRQHLTANCNMTIAP